MKHTISNSQHSFRFMEFMSLRGKTIDPIQLELKDLLINCLQDEQSLRQICDCHEGGV